jgi:hypothetical protein
MQSSSLPIFVSLEKKKERDAKIGGEGRGDLIVGEEGVKG